jgi:hypothetical protein
VDAVLTRTGDIDLRKVYVGPNNVDPEDMVNLISGVTAAAVTFAFPDLDARLAAKAQLLAKLDERISGETQVETMEEAIEDEGEVE